MTRESGTRGSEVREMTGLYGPFFLEERQVQRIWAARAFSGRGLVTRSGRRLEILDPGRWNFQEGPDFRDAILEIDGRRTHGDVEIHLHEKDWRRHGHGEDPRFAGVILHVVLFPDRTGAARRDGDEPFETLEWLPHLDRDLEGYLDDLSVDRLMGAEWPASVRELLELPVEAREARLHRAALERWERKVTVARRRLAANQPQFTKASRGTREETPESPRSGRPLFAKASQGKREETPGSEGEDRHLAGYGEAWEASCHQVFLETLGLRRNRATMGRIACEEPIAAWVDDPAGTAARAWEGHAGGWSLAGCRPANHPRRRLESYAEWIVRRGNPWSGEIPWRDLSAESSPAAGRPPRVSAGRKALRLGEQERRLRAFFAPGVGGTRFHTWMADGLLPLLAARDGVDRFRPWFLWPVGDVPDRIKAALKTLEILGPGRPLGNGWTQGLLRVLEPDYGKESSGKERTPPA